ncbi:MAG: hypothetical protein HPY79_12515, partial [Bacteroidales bacterium]|nr:hypothetical protein [Bacteroidales bacterium]
LLIYQTDNTPGYYYYDGSAWQLLGRYVAGTGISIVGNTISNTAPDQTVSIGSGTGISVTGSYPNFTVTNTGVTASCATANYIPKTSTSTTLTCSQIYDNGTNVGIGTASPGTKLDVVGVGRFGLTTNGNVCFGNDGNGIAYMEMRESDGAGTPYIDFSNDNSSDYDARIMLEANDRLIFATTTNGRQLSIHSTGIALSGSSRYINFNTTFDASGYGFRDNGGTLEYKHSGGTWTPFAQPPTVPGNVEWWIRPTNESYIRPLYNGNARVYDAGQTWAFYYDGSNVKGSFMAGGDVGLIMHRSGVSSTYVPSFSGDQFPFIDAGNDASITSADNITYTGGYAYGSLFNGFTGVSKCDAGIRGIGLGGTSGTNSSWPVVGVIGEVIATGSSANGQQGVYGWQAAPAGSASFCIGTLGRTSQTGNQSAGVAGYYTNSVGNLVSCFSSFQSLGMLGTGTTGVTGQTSVVGGYGVLGINTDLTSYTNVGVQGQVGDGTSKAVDFKAVVGISNNTHDLYGYGGYFQGEWYGVYAYNPTTTSGNAVYYSGGLAGSGTKSCVMRTSQGPKALYCLESPENYFEDYGTARLVNGRARIDIDPLFLETITINNDNPYKVFIQMIDEIPNNVHIVKHDHYFEVVENNNGTSNAEFDWRLLAKRKGYENLRLKDTPEAYTDPALYPDPNDPSIPIQWREKVKAHFEFIEKTKHVPVQKYEAEKKPDIDKKVLEQKNKN